MTWGAIASAAVSAGVGIYNANKQAKATKQAAAATAPNPYGVMTPFGTMSNDNGVLSYQMAQNPFMGLLSSVGTASLANAGTAPGSFLYGADPELAAAYKGLSGPELEAAGNERYSLLTQLAQPEQQRSKNALQDSLFAQGRLGTTGGGIQQEAFQNAANMADLQRQLAGQDWAQQQASNRFSAALNAVGSGQRGQEQQWNMGTGAITSQGNIFGQLLQAGSQGIGAGGGQAPGAAMMAAQMSTSPFQAGYGALQQSGLLDKGIGAITNWWQNRNAGSYMPTTTPTGAPVVGGSATNPYGLDFGPPKSSGGGF